MSNKKGTAPGTKPSPAVTQQPPVTPATNLTQPPVTPAAANLQIYEFLTCLMERHCTDRRLYYEQALVVKDRTNLNSRSLHYSSMYQCIIQVTYFFSHIVQTNRCPPKVDVLFDNATTRAGCSPIIMRLDYLDSKDSNNQSNGLDELKKVLRDIIDVSTWFQNKQQPLLQPVRELLRQRNKDSAQQGTLEEFINKLQSTELFQRRSNLLLYSRYSPLLQLLHSKRASLNDIKSMCSNSNNAEVLADVMPEFVKSLGFCLSQQQEKKEKLYMELYRLEGKQDKGLSRPSVEDSDTAPLRFNISIEQNLLVIRHITRYVSAMECSDFLVCLSNQTLAQVGQISSNIITEFEQYGHTKYLSFSIRLNNPPEKDLQSLSFDLRAALDALLIYAMVFANSKMSMMQVSRCDELQEIEHYMRINRSICSFTQCNLSDDPSEKKDS